MKLLRIFTFIAFLFASMNLSAQITIGTITSEADCGGSIPVRIQANACVPTSPDDPNTSTYPCVVKLFKVDKNADPATEEFVDEIIVEIDTESELWESVFNDLCGGFYRVEVYNAHYQSTYEQEGEIKIDCAPHRSSWIALTMRQVFHVHQNKSRKPISI